MSRSARVGSESGIYHVVDRGAGKGALFEDDDDRSFFLEKLRRARQANEMTIFAWCLMDTHVHLATQGSLTSLSCMMRSLNAAYARYYNARHGHAGPVFQGRFQSFPVDSERCLVELIRSIHLNPRRAGLADYRSYPWSSYREIARGGSICDRDKVLAFFGGGAASFASFSAYHRRGCASEEAGGARSGEPGLTEGSTRARRVLSDAEALAKVVALCGERGAEALAAMPRAERDRVIRRLRECGLTVRQIERLTGIGRGIVQRC